MKQLLAISEEYAIVGLGDRIFVGRLDQEVEVVYELGLDTPVAAVAPPSSDNNSGSDVNPREVQAVALHKSKDHLDCAVSCLNKNLLVYRIDLSPNGGVTNALKHQTISPTTIHKTFKRAGCLCFADVPVANDGESSLTVVIAGDSSGDAVAFSLVAASGPDPTVVQKGQPLPSEGGDENANADESIQNRRVLLGHTASMLTGVKVVKDESTCRILTSDRDEKVRVSSFPNSFLVHGFLLGHEAFVSSMDVSLVDGVTRCITCSGDGTVRLWDYASCRELSSFSVSHDSGVPSRVCMNAWATVAAVAFDESPRLDILQIEEADGTLKLLTTLECSTPALALAMLNGIETLLVLVTESPFLCAYRLQRSGIFSPDAVEIPFVRALSNVLAATHAEGTAIGMPTTVLEKDQNGQLMLKKNREKRGPAFNRPWDNAERKAIAKERERRYKHQKQQNRKSKRAKSDSASDVDGNDS